jgi:hypothetical protein
MTFLSIAVQYTLHILYVALVVQGKDISNYPNCKVPKPDLIGDGECFNFGEYNTADCGFDGEDCLNFNIRYPECTAEFANFIGDGKCDGGKYNTAECGSDGGDCDLLNKYPDCNLGYDSLNNSICEKPFNTPECGFDGGDCRSFNEKYPTCDVDFPQKIGDGVCNGASYNTEACGNDGGDCSSIGGMYWWNVLIFSLVGTIVLISIMIILRRQFSNSNDDEVILVDSSSSTSKTKSTTIPRPQTSSSSRKTPKTAEEIKQWRRTNFNRDSGSGSEDQMESTFRKKRTRQGSSFKGQEV